MISKHSTILVPDSL